MLVFDPFTPGDCLTLHPTKERARRLGLAVAKRIVDKALMGEDRASKPFARPGRDNSSSHAGFGPAWTAPPTPGRRARSEAAAVGSFPEGYCTGGEPPRWTPCSKPFGHNRLRSRHLVRSHRARRRGEFDAILQGAAEQTRYAAAPGVNEALIAGGAFERQTARPPPPGTAASVAAGGRSLYRALDCGMRQARAGTSENGGGAVLPDRAARIRRMEQAGRRQHKGWIRRACNAISPPAVAAHRRPEQWPAPEERGDDAARWPRTSSERRGGRAGAGSRYQAGRGNQQIGWSGARIVTAMSHAPRSC